VPRESALRDNSSCVALLSASQLLTRMPWCAEQPRTPFATEQDLSKVPERELSYALHTCLGDLYSVAWIELAERAALDGMELQVEYQRVRARTSNNFTYEMVRAAA
jgi:hypothetical protein